VDVAIAGYVGGMSHTADAASAPGSVPIERMDDARRALLGLVGLGGVAALAAMAKGGPLTPPAGPVSSTGHTTDELLTEIRKRRGAIPISAETTPGDGTCLFRISQPGSYFLPSDFTAPTATLPLLLITGDEVDVDLSGHMLAFGSSSGSNPPVLQIGNNSYQPNSVRIHDGIVTASGNTAVVFGGPCFGISFDNVNFQGCRTGIGAGAFGVGNITFRRCVFVGGGATTLDLGAATKVYVERCLFEACTTPINVGNFSSVEACTVVITGGQATSGIQVGPQSTVLDCQVIGYGVNFGSTPNVAGILTGDACRVERNQVANSTRSISIASFCSALDNCITGGVNTGTGVYCNGQRNTVQRNLISSQNVGVQCGTVGNNVVMHNVFANVGSGIVATSPGNLIGTFLNPGNQASQTSPWCNLYVA
jgi:hypothetical protein